MTESTMHDYHSRREAQERDLAAKATDNACRNIHDELADRHAAMIDERPRR